MSAKDLRSFVTLHRADDAERMVRRAREGVACTHFRPVDYDQLKSVISDKKFAGQESLMKLKRIEWAARHRKDENALKQHLNIWNRELVRLGTARRQIEADIQSSARETLFNEEDNIVEHLFEELALHRDALDEEFAAFKRDTTDPIWQLRNDLCIWLDVHNGGTANKYNVELDEPEDILATIASVKQQQDRILNMLSAEQASLESELHIDGLQDPVVCSDTKHVQTGIPEEAFDLQCPNLELKVTVLQQFIFLDGKYVEKLNELEQQHNDVLSDVTGGWFTQDHDLFVFVYDSYNARDVTSSRRLMFIDCLQRCLPHKTRADVVKHEDWWMRTKFFHQRRRDLLSGWSRDRIELLNRIKNIFNEACLSKQLEDMKLENRQKQQEFCDHLCAKVSEWHQRKMEAFRLDQEIAEATRVQAELLRAAEDEREKMRRQQQKYTIQKFHKDLEAKRLKKEEADKQRLKELQSYLDEQAERDRERVMFREEEFLRKQKDKQKKKEEQQVAAEEKERILEAIRAKVRPEVEGDLMRLWSDTEAWKARQQPEEHIDIQKPLFDIKSFTSERIMADPRVRVEQRIREAGLQNSEYARSVLHNLKPVHPPRRDTVSTLFT